MVSHFPRLADMKNDLHLSAHRLVIHKIIRLISNAFEIVDIVEILRLPKDVDKVEKGFNTTTNI